MKTILPFFTFIILFLLPMTLHAQGCTGTYDNGYGKIFFTQIGNNVTATYDATGGQGKFSGKMTNNTLYGTWTQGGRRGKIRFVFSADFSSFEAQWGENDGPLVNEWGRAVRINAPSQTINCFNLFHLGLLMGGLEMGAYEGYNSTWMIRTIDYALDHVEATNCIDDNYLLDLRNRIRGFDNTNSFLNEIQTYKDNLIIEIQNSCSCCMSCIQ